MKIGDLVCLNNSLKKVHKEYQTYHLTLINDNFRKYAHDYVAKLIDMNFIGILVHIEKNIITTPFCVFVKNNLFYSFDEWELEKLV